LGWQVRQERAETLGASIPAEEETQTQGAPVHVPLHHEFDALAFGEFGVDGLQRLITERAPPFAIFAKRLKHLRVPPGFGADEKEAACLLHVPQVVKINIATIGQEHAVSERGWLRQKRLFLRRVGGQDHSGGGIAEQVHGGMELDSRGFHRLETPRKDLPQAIVDGKGTPVLNDDMAKCAQRAPFFEPEHFERHLTNEPFRHSPGEIGKVRFGHLIREGLVGDGRTKEGIAAAVEISNGLDTLAGTGRRQGQGQAKGREEALASTQFHVFATRIEQRFGKHPLELVSDHAKVSVIHRGLLSLYLKQHAQEELLMDRHKNPQ